MKIDGATSVLVHLAYPSAHLRTPQLFNPRCAERGLNAVLVPWQVAPEHLADTMKTLRKAESIAGAIVTLPHKETSAAYCDRLDGVAEILAVANVIRRQPDGLWSDVSSMARDLSAACTAPMSIRRGPRC